MQSCGNCTLCCKLLRIPETLSVAGTWCRHCSQGEGCTIYSSRPESCRIFECVWKQMDNVSQELRPDRCHMLFEKRSDTVIVGATDCEVSSLLLKQIDHFRSEGISVLILNHKEKSKTFYLAPGHTKEYVKGEINGRSDVLNRSADVCNSG
jgi:hypothetical protein